MSMLDRRIAPINPEPIHVAFPHTVEHTLSNGLKVMLYEQHDVPVVNVRLYIRAGSVLDGKALKASSFVFALLQQGTHKRTANEIADEIEFLGAELTASSSIDFGSVSLTVMRKHLEKGLEILSDVVLNPAFMESEIEFVRQQSLSRLQFSKADATRLSSEAFNRLIYAPHPYGNPSLGTIESLKALTREQLLEFYRKYFLANRAFITVAGDIEADTMIALLETYFGAWASHEVEELLYELPQKRTQSEVRLVKKDGAVQSVLNIGHLSIARNDEAFIPLYVGNMILGGYFGSRLNMNLREKQGFTYGIRSGFDALRLAGDFNISTQVRNEVTGETIEQILFEVNRLLQEGISEKELTAAKRYIMGNFVIQNEVPTSIAVRLANVELYGLPKSYYNTYLDAINALERQQILDELTKHLHTESFVFVIAGDPSQVSRQVERFGALSVEDADGNLIT
ncbi:MAG: M16 family metallopeptidase [Chloroherpetonaceae bacterium]